MDIKIESTKAMIATWVSIMIATIGESYKHIFVLVLLMAVDTIIGWAKGKKLNTWKSSIARWGAVGKIIELMLISCMYGLDWVFEINYLKYIGIYYFGICEIASIFENFAEMGGNVPEGSIELLKNLQYSVGTSVVQKVKKIIESLRGE